MVRFYIFFLVRPSLEMTWCEKKKATTDFGERKSGDDQPFTGMSGLLSTGICPAVGIGFWNGQNCLQNELTFSLMGYLQLKTDRF
jgi:hypothetical protein